MRETIVTVEIKLEDIESDVIAYVRDNIRPEDVFPENELKEWAEDNGYVKEGE